MFLAILIFATSTITYGADWNQTKSGLENTTDITEPEKSTGLIWLNQIGPGEDLLLTKVTYSRYQKTFFMRYVFVGIVGNSMQINTTGSSQDKGEKSALSDKSFENLLYVERAKDGAFYFVPKDNDRLRKSSCSSKR